MKSKLSRKLLVILNGEFRRFLPHTFKAELYIPPCFNVQNFSLLMEYSRIFVIHATLRTTVLTQRPLHGDSDSYMSQEANL